MIEISNKTNQKTSKSELTCSLSLNKWLWRMRFWYVL